jgi:phospho-N-acetylmuramoyl-pentapeptide-transferase
VTAILVAAAVGLFVALLGTPLAIRAFRGWGIGQVIREDGPQGHLEKMGTPTMGGVVIIAGMMAAYLAARFEFRTFTVEGLAVLGVTVALGLVGAMDDLLKIRRQRSLGLNKRAKFLGQLLVSVAFAAVIVAFTEVSTNLSFTRPTALALGFAFYLWVFLMISASSNGVNLTDGLDGLASGSSARGPGATRWRSTPRSTRPSWPQERWAPPPGSCGGTRRPPRSSWATPGPWPSGGSWRRWPS